MGLSHDMCNGSSCGPTGGKKTGSEGGLPVETEQASDGHRVEGAGAENLYLYNIDQGGFVIISGDDRTRVVLGYDRNGHLNADNLPDNLLYWLKEYQHQISQLGNITLQELYAAYPPNSDKPTLPDSVAPLLTSEWNQYRYGYNSLVPYDSTYANDSTMARFDNHPTVGCAALAMGQIMRYWQFPQHGYGSQPLRPQPKLGVLALRHRLAPTSPTPPTTMP